MGAPEASEVQVAVQATGLCGSDLHYFNHYRNGDIIVQEPLTLGHESSGVVTAVGSQVTKLKFGDRVALEVGLPCLECDLCKEGRYNICKSLRFRSSAKSFPHFQGTLQERINHPAVYCHKCVSDKWSERSALTELDYHQVFPSTLEPSLNRWELLSIAHGEQLSSLEAQYLSLEPALLGFSVQQWPRYVVPRPSS